jgi:hypothetical protein
MRYGAVTLDPDRVEESIQQLIQFFELTAEDLPPIRRIVAMYSQPAQMYFDETSALLQHDMVLADKFTFDIDTDTLILFSREKNTLIDALIEMAMYLAGFSTMMGTEEAWVIEFTIGAWKPVKKQIKRQIGLDVTDQPRGIVGLPPPPEEADPGDVYPFQTLVSRLDRVSFRQMVVLAARDDIAVYFPPRTHPNVMEVYTTIRQAIQYVSKDIGLAEYQMFNERLVEEIQNVQNQFKPSELPFPSWLSDLANRSRSRPTLDDPGLFLPLDAPPSSPKRHDPFEAFIDELFPDDDPDSGDR